MNRFGLLVWEHLVRTRPEDLAAITDPTAWFEQLGEQIETEITTTLHPATSVVDAKGRAHGCPNLLVLDGSVFVTAAALNPTSTIQALALRAADALVRDRRKVPVAA